MKYGIDKICTINSDQEKFYSKRSIEWFFSSLQTKLTGKIDLAIKYRRKELLSSASKGDLFLSVGGDNYCYAGTEILAALNRNLKKKGAKLVLWGCSVEPSLLRQQKVVWDLATFDLITARESESYSALKKINDNTILVADPAFTLDTVKKSLPQGWIEDNMIGVNASPLILQSGKNGGVVYEAYRRLLSYIIQETSSGIALIPHVVCQGNDDREVLKQLYSEFHHTGRVVLVADCNCMELKGYIARCRLFVGARTHATIAAYSSCVPTLVLGYSVKSRGIARDLFGTEEHFVLPVQKLDDPEQLVIEFKWLMENEENVRHHLQLIIPEYIGRAYLARDAVMKVMYQQ